MNSSEREAGAATRRARDRRAGADRYVLAVLALVLLSGCGPVPSPEPPPTTGTGLERADTEPSAVEPTSTTRSPDTLPSASATEPEEHVSASLATSIPTPPVTVDADAPTDSTTREPGHGARTDHDPRTAEPSGTPQIRVLDVLPHDPAAFTQGLALHEGLFYESTGLYGASTVRIVDPESGTVLSSVSLGERFFGEGLEVVGGRVVQLTWKEQTAFVWEVGTLEPLGTYTYVGEGWGLCAFEDRFVMSDGSSTLTFRDLDSFEVIGTVEVVLSGQPVDMLNELECVGELVYANVWFSDEIMMIAADSGQVVARVDASSLRGHLSAGERIDVLNGIAHDPHRRVFYLTGKRWPEIFEVRIGEGP